MDDLAKIKDNYKLKHEDPETNDAAVKKMFHYEKGYTE